MEELIEKYKDLPLKKRLIIVFLLSIAYPLLNYTEEIQLLEETLESTVASYNSQSAKLKRGQRNVKKLPKLEEEIDHISSQLETAQKYLPDSIEFDTVLASFGSYEKELGVRLLKFVPGEAKKENKTASYMVVPLEIELEATFEKVMLYLDRIAHRPDLIHIRSLSFVPEQTETRTEDGSPPAEELVKAGVQLVFFQKDS